MLNKHYLTPDQHEGLQSLKETLESDEKILTAEIVAEGIAQKEFRNTFTSANPMDATSRDKLEKMKTAQFERGDRLSAIKKEINLYNYEVATDAPLTRSELTQALEAHIKAQNSVNNARRGFPEDELGSEQASNLKQNAPNLFDTMGAWVMNLNEGRSLENYFKKDGFGVQRVTFKARFGERAANTPDEEMFDVTVPETSSAIKEATKSGYTNTPANNPAFPFGSSASIGGLGLMCGWKHLDISCLMPFPQNCVANMFTEHDEQGVSVITFDRQLTTANNFAPVPESIASGLMLAQAANKPFLDYGFLTIVVPLVSIAGIYTISEQALRHCGKMVDRVKETAGLQFAERESIQMLQGTGGTSSSPQLLGLNNQIGIQSHSYRDAPYGTPSDYIPDAIAQSVVALQNTGCQADTLIMNPLDALRVRTQKDSQGRPVYQIVNGSTGEIFDLPNFCPTIYQPKGTAITTAKSNINAVNDGEIVYAMGWMNDDFRQNLRRLRWERMRAIFVCRPECVVRTNDLS